MKRSAKFYAACALLLAGGALVAFVTSQLVAGSEDDADLLPTGDRSESVAGSEDDAGPVPPPDRSQLSVCVDGAGGLAVSSADVDAVGAALQDALASAPLEVPDEYSDPTVVAGCPPPPPALLDESISPVLRPDELAVLVETPSDHLLFVYFMPSETYAFSFGDVPYTKVDQEVVCPTDDCITTSLSLYFPESPGHDLLRDALLDILSLVPRPPEPTIDWSACERGEEPFPFTCESYEDYKQDLEWEQEQGS